MLFENSLGTFFFFFCLYTFFFMNRNIMCRQNKLLEESKGPFDTIVLIMLFILFKNIYKKKMYEITYNII